MIPSTVTNNGTTYTVTGIGVYAFCGCTNLTNVTIPNSVTNIGFKAFYYCTSLTNVTIGNSVTSIGYYAFGGCTGLTSVTIPNSVTSIGGSAFYDCNGLTNVTLGNSVTSIGDRAFQNCTSLTSIIIPNSVTYIGAYAFCGCDGLTSVTIDNSATGIGDYAFSGCIGLTSINIPNSVNYIGRNSFNNCTNLTNVTIGNSVTSIGNYAFYHCTSLTSVTIGNSITSIESYSFCGCIELTSVIMRSSNAPSLGSYVFSYTPESMVVEIPCGSYAFYLQAWGYNYNYIENHPDFIISLQSNNNEWGIATIQQQSGHDIACDSTAIISATANEGYCFVQWNDGNTENPRTVTVISDTNLTAIFANACTVTATANDATMGSVTGGGSYGVGATVTLTAVPAPCHHFVSWSNGTTTESITITATGDDTLTATFARDAAVVGTDVQTACDSYTWIDGITYTSSNNTATYNLTNAAGCDSTTTLHLTINHSNTGVETVAACDHYVWHGTEYTASNNTATFVSTNAAGCDSTTTLHLTINHSSTGIDEQTACETFTWIDGITYTTSNNAATYSLTTAAGCDSTVTLHLTINHGRYTHEYVTHCGPYTWPVNGRTYNQSGEKYNSGTTDEGCPIRDTLSLTVNQNSESDLTLEIGTADLPYNFEGQTFETFGQYDVVIENAVGCDSTIHLTLAHNSGIQSSIFEVQNLAIYPNPTTGLVHIDIIPTLNAHLLIEVLDLAGRRVALFENTATLDLTGLAAGTYTLRITMPDGVAIRKVVKR